MKKRFARNTIAASSAIAMLTSSFTGAFASDLNGTTTIKCTPGDNISVGTYAESAAETQKLINARPNIQRQVEDMGRGLVAVKTDNGNFISWRWKGTESINVKYNLYKNGTKLNSAPLDLTNYTDIDGKLSDKYSVSTVVDGAEGEKCEEVSVWDGYYEIPLGEPPAPAEVEGEPGNPGEYGPGEIAVADLDGDGEYEFVIKWNAITRDAGKGGYTSICYLDGYELDGTFMWRVNMGPNIRSGEHDTQFMVADFDGDGKAEMACRTADGTVSGTGEVIGDAKAEWYKNNNGKNLDGPLYLTVFKGEDGSIIDTIDYYPQSTGTWDDGTEWGIDSWGDDWGNRSERYLGGVATFDGVRTSFIQSRGYYDRTCIGAWHLEDGKIVEDWTFDSHYYPRAKDTDPSKNGQGYHNLTVADVDFDGKDEIMFGNLAIDHDGTPMYTTGLGHGDALHLGDLLPSRPGLEMFTVQESGGAAYGFAMRDARTGEILYGLNTGTDVGRGATADIDPRYEGEEAWSAYGALIAADGTVLSTNYSIPANFAIYWDGDLGREIEDGNGVYKYDPDDEKVHAIFKAVGAHSINAAKSNPCIQADIFGDWREELIFPANDNKSLRIYTTTEPTAYRIPTLTSDSEYYNAVIWQNNCYNQPPHVSYNLGYDMKEVPVPQVFTLDADGNKITNPDLATRKSYSVDELYFGDTVELVLDNPTALVNGAKVLVDNENPAVKPYLDAEDRTLVPLRFIAEAFGATVNYDDETTEITITVRDTKGDTAITMKPGETAYTISHKSSKGNDSVGKGEMDTVPVVENERTMVPVRFIAEALGKYVDYYDGLVYISTIEKPLDNADEVKAKINATSKAVRTPNYADIEDYGDKTRGLRYDPVAITTSNDTDGSAVADYDPTTTWTCPAGGEIIFQKANWFATPAAVVMFGDDKQHHFDIMYSGNGTDWQLAVSNRISSGKSGVYEKFYFGVPPYPTYVKYVSLDDEDTEIAELAFAITD
ncbi:MAG: hypothetical protein J1G06_01850 [Oscillospiraceae bacterium]|nr:hypothetical protein [Oscillospiraceae bacterium]